MNEKDLIHKMCKYSFKGLSCKLCPLKCVYKNKAKVILGQRESIEKLLENNKKLKAQIQGYQKLLGSCESDLLQLTEKNNEVIKKISEVEERNHNLTLENEELKKQVRFKNQFKDYAHKYKQCLDEIEKYCKGKNFNFVAPGYILRLIKQAKEGGE